MNSIDHLGEYFSFLYNTSNETIDISGDYIKYDISKKEEQIIRKIYEIHQNSNI